MPLNKIDPLKADANQGYEEPFDQNTDALNVAGVYVQSSTSDDTSVLITRDTSDNLTFTDPVLGLTKTLTQLAAASSGVTEYEFLLDNEPDASDTTYSNTYASNRVVNETWILTSNSKDIKTIDYTYSSGKLSTEVRKIYAPDGTTVVAQVTITNTYSGSLLSSSVLTRDV